MREREQIKTPEEVRFEKFSTKYLDVLKDKEIPDVCKLLLRQKDIVLLIAGLKPMTNVDFNHEMLDELKMNKSTQNLNLELFRDILKRKFGILSTDIKKSIEVESFYIYDSEQIKLKIADFKELKSWPSDNNLEGWIEENLQAGVPRDLVYGALYGFPRSAIDFKVKVDYLGGVKHKNIGLGDENYGVPVGELADDVKTREKQKEDLFRRLDEDGEIQGEYKKTDKLKREFIEIRRRIIKKHEEKNNHK